jgi:hypothetical protein
MATKTEIRTDLETRYGLGCYLSKYDLMDYLGVGKDAVEKLMRDRDFNYLGGKKKWHVIDVAQALADDRRNGGED